MLSSTLISCPSIGTHYIQRNDKSRALIVDTMIISFTPTEYRLLVPLLKGQPVQDVDLMHEAYSGQVYEGLHDNLSKHIDKIRSKLCPSGINVHRVAKYGYVLLAASD